VEPEFVLPNCYTVLNTQPVHSKIQSFSDETLFYIFYTMPRDIMQEVVVAELYHPRSSAVPSQEIY
jgi:CCR4-NOT transcription complex subunit 2